MKAVVFGAGNIGRGFLGQLFSQSGYEIVFVELAEEIIEQLNADGSYRIRIVGEREQTYDVQGVRAIHARDVERISGELETADIVATAAGVNALPAVAETLAQALKGRFAAGNHTELNVIICENIIDSGEHLKRLVLRHLPEQYHPLLEQKVGWVATVVSRMVPVLTEQMRKENPAQVAVEPYCILPVDKKAFKGPLPKIEGFDFSENLAALEERKLFAHNAGHALCAYFGYEKGFTYTYEAVHDKEIRRKTLRGLGESGRALIKKHGFSPKEHRAHIEDLLHRFANVALGDTVARVARDPIRKLGRRDRLIGSALLALEYGVKPVSLTDGIVAALRYDDPEDEKAMELQRLLSEEGMAHVLETVCGLHPSERLFEMVSHAYRVSRRSRRSAQAMLQGDPGRGGNES
jgi:mannitol-1-phosphate 5-dehydrogenase